MRCKSFTVRNPERVKNLGYNPGMKIRSITYFIDTGWPLDVAALKRAGTFLQAAKPAFESAGYEVQTARLATIPFTLMMPTLDPGALVRLAQALEQAAGDLGFAYVSLGPALPADPQAYAAIPAALAETLLKQGHRVSLLSFGQGLQRVFPGYGKVQLQRMLNILSQIKPGTNYALESIKNLPTRLFSASSQLIIITPLTREDQEGLIGLCAQGYNVLVLCPRIPEAEIPVGADILPQALRLKKVERRMLIHRLSRAGIQIAEWPVEIPLENALRQVSGLAAQRSRGQTRSV